MTWWQPSDSAALRPFSLRIDLSEQEYLVTAWVSESVPFGSIAMQGAVVTALLNVLSIPLQNIYKISLDAESSQPRRSLLVTRAEPPENNGSR